MKIIVTGAEGFIGQRLCQSLKVKGQDLIELDRYRADILDKEAMRLYFDGVRQVYHLAALAGVWSKDKLAFDKINVEGTKNIIELCLESGVEKLVYVSSAGVIGPQKDENLVDETALRIQPFFNTYERTKFEAEQLIQEAVQKGMDAVIVNPTRVYGPGKLSQSNSLTLIIKKYLEGNWKFIPGNGKSIGNYVFVEDIVVGMQLAMEKGKAGNRYLLGGENVTWNQFFDQLSKVSNQSRTMRHIPLSLMQIASNFMMLGSYLGVPPKITPDWVRRYLFNWGADISKAKNELGYQPRSLKEGLSETISWLKSDI